MFAVSMGAVAHMQLVVVTVSASSSEGGYSETIHTHWSARIMRASANNDIATVGEIEMAVSAGNTDFCTGGSVFFSSEYNDTGEAAANAFDNNLSTHWSNSSGAFPSRIGYTPPSPTIATEFRMWARDDGFTDYGPIGLDWEYSDDGSTHYCYGSVDDAAWGNGENKNFNFSGSPYGSYSAMRVYVRGSADFGPNIRIAEIEYAATWGGADQCTGGTASGTADTPANSFDNNTSTYSTSNGSPTRHLWQYTFASPVEGRECRVTAWTDTAYPIQLIVQVLLANGLWKTVAHVDTPSWTAGETKTVQW